MSTLRRRDFLSLTAGVAANGLFPRGAASVLRRSAPSRPNVLFLSIDDLRPELGCYGVAGIRTPAIDALARRGVVFDRAYCQQSLCNPSRQSLLTGLRPDTIGVWDLESHFRRRRADIVTLPQAFKARGYTCLNVGKTFHATQPDPPSWSRPDTPVPPRYTYMSPETRVRQGVRQAAARRRGMSEAWITAYLRGPATECFDADDSLYWDGAMTETAVDLLRGLKETQPFFLGLGFVTTHLPFIAPRRYWDLYDRGAIPMARNPYLPKGAPLYAMNDFIELACYEDFVSAPSPTEGRLDEARARLLKHGYYACLSFVDALIGRVLAELDSLGLRDNTIVCLWGDNSYKLGEHGGWGKQTNYEVDTRTPLIIAAPGLVPAGGRSEALVELVDVYPTLCGLAGVPAPDGLEGSSLEPLFKEPGRAWKTAAFSQYPKGFTNRFMGRALRTDRWRYVEWRDLFDDRLDAVELYDHASDPDENDNVAAEPDRKEVLAELAQRLGAGWRAARPK